MTKVDVVDGHGVVLSQEELMFLGSKNGKRRVELPDRTPMAPPVGFNRRPPLHIQIREMVQRELSARAEAEGFETAEEADDFDVGDDFDPSSPYEHDFEPAKPAAPASEQIAVLEARIAKLREGLAEPGASSPATTPVEGAAPAAGAPEGGGGSVAPPSGRPTSGP